jgi:hypothetical protein
MNATIANASSFHHHTTTHSTFIRRKANGGTESEGEVKRRIERLLLRLDFCPQGDASALSFAIQYPGRAKNIIACDTQAKAPESNKQAWQDQVGEELGSMAWNGW